MSINVASQTGVTNGRRNILPVYNTPSSSQTVTTYVRPSDWLAMPAVTNTEQKIVLLYAVFNDESNFMALNCNTSAGTYTVDWGDGTANSVTAGGTIAQHKYNWNDVSGTTLTTRGYRQAIITITPTTANLTSISLNNRYVDTSTSIPSYAGRVLESLVSGPNCTIVQLSGTQQAMTLMEQSQILSTGTSCSLSSCYYLSYSLQNIVGISANLGTITNTVNMFNSCSRLETVPLFNTALVTSMIGMFEACFSLISVPAFDTTVCTTFSLMFNSCYRLKNAPFLTPTTALTDANSMFANCYSLVNVPLYNTLNVTNGMASMFINCTSLKTCPNFNTIKVTTMASMFSGCVSLQTVPIFNYAACTTTSAMFSNCNSFTIVPALYLPVVTTMNAMFQNCFRVISHGTVTTSNSLANLSQTYIQNKSITNLPLITQTSRVTNMTEFVYLSPSLSNVANIALYDTSNVTTMSGMFASCTALQNVPDFTTTKVATFDRLFLGTSIVTAPTLDTSNATSMSQMFYQANTLVTVPAYNTSKVTNMSTMFQTTISLSAVPAFDTSNVTNFTTFLYQSGAKTFDANLNTSKGLTFTNFVAQNYQLQSIPAFNMANATSIGAAFNNNQNLGNVNVTNIKITTSFASSSLGANALQNIFANSLLSNNTTQTITITGNPGAITALTKTATWTNTSNVMTMANTVGVIVGSQVSNTANVNLVYAGTLTSNKVSVASVIDANTIVSFTTVTTSNALANTLYYTSNRAGGGPYTYDISTTQGGTPNTFTDGTANMRVNLLVTTVNTNANVVLNAYPAGNGTATSVTTRALNTNLASYKGWTVTG